MEQKINPFVEQWEREEQFDAHYVFKELGRAGLLGLTRSKRYNGQELPYSFTVALYEELSRTVNAGGVVSGIAVQTDMATPALANFGSDALRQQFLAPTLAGDFVACVGISEATGGSDVSALETSAKRDGDDLVINGEKMWITNGLQADWMCLLANTSQGSPHKNKSLLCVPLDAKGVSFKINNNLFFGMKLKQKNLKVSRSKIAKLGQHSSDTAIVAFDNVRVPYTNIIGDADQGFMYQMIQFQEERLCVAAGVGPALQRIIDQTIDYCRERYTFGRPLIENQSIHFRLAELQCELELFKSLFYEAAAKFQDGQDVTYLASILKYKAGQLCRQVPDTCLQFFGGLGYSAEMPISRAFRDLRLMSIAGGADEIMLGIICKYMGTLPKRPSTK